MDPKLTQYAQLKFELAPDILIREIGAETIVVNLRTNEIVSLNHPGGSLLASLDNSRNRADLLTELSARYDVSQATLAHEIGESIDELLRLQIIVPRES